MKAAYTSCKGDMDGILDTVMCAEIDDIPRFKKIIKAGIKAGELKSFKAFEKDDRQKQEARKAKVGGGLEINVTLDTSERKSRLPLM